MLGDLGYLGLGLFVANLAWRSGDAGVFIAWPGSTRNYRDSRVYANALISALAVYCVTGSFLSAQYNEMAWHLFALSAALRLIAQDEVRAGAPTARRHGKGRLMHISVIVPVRDDATRLRRCLQSIRRDALRTARTEIIVADNGSRDDSPQVAADAGARVLLLPDLTGVRAEKQRRRRGLGRRPRVCRRRP